MKKLLAFLLVAVMAMGLCSVASAEGYDQALIDAAKAEGELTVYGSCEEAYLNAACDKFQELFGITVNRQRLSTGEVAAKIEEENGNPSADVWFGGTTDPYNESVAKGLLEPYEAKNASHLLGDMYRDKDGCWYGIYKGILGFMCNTEELERLGLEEPKEWDDLLKPEYKGLLKNIDPSLEEASRDMGASRWKVFTTVTLPLLLPGLGNAFLVTFIESVADFANPMMIGGSFDTLATTIYLQVTGAYDKAGASAMAVVLLSLTLILFLIQKYYLEKRTYATLTGKASRARMLIADKSVTRPLTILCSLFSAFVILMYVSIPFGALFNLWGRDYSLTFKHFEYMFKYSGLKAFRDSFVLSLIASPITALLSMIISYLVVKRKFRTKGLIEFASMLAMAVPGTVLGVGYIRGFANGVFHTGFLQGLYGTGAILVIVFIVRSLPVGTRSGISALRQIDKSIEESAYDLGAGSGKVFTSVTLPLIKDSFLSGLVTTFVRSITAISAIILLVTPQYLLITTQINEFAEKGKYGVACAYATILIAIVYASIVIMNLVTKYFGTSRKIKGDSDNA